MVEWVAPVVLEVREFVVKYALPDLHETEPDVDREKNPRRQTQRKLPVASLRDIINSLFEENRYEEGTRFLNTLGDKELVKDAKLVGNLLAIFKSTKLIEKDLRQRSSFLLQNIKGSSIDHSQIWKVNNERRKLIIHAQHSILGYLEAAKVQFVRCWFDETYSNEPEQFWTLFNELTALPDEYSDATTYELELELYHNRISIAAILLEQVCADLAANAGNMRRSVFLKIASEGFSTSGRISNPKLVLETIFAKADSISYQRSPVKESKLAKLLLDMLAVASASDHINRDNCVQTIAKHLSTKSTQSMVEFIDLVDSDLLVVEVIDYMLLSWYRFTAKPTKVKDLGTRQAIALRPSITKTAFCLYNAVPLSRKNQLADWYDLTCLLARLVQRSMNAFVSRMSHANSGSEASASSSTAPPSLVLVVNTSPDCSLLGDAYGALRTHVEEIWPPLSSQNGDSSESSLSDLDSSGGSDPDDSDSDSEYSDRELTKMIYTELDLLGSYLG
ncbi:hypothetical protein GGI12_001868 [Dipsacomyces acuminosporus]|nr:hypothetical protein GGI12_001868 [Dipsacomyces acuminosporus]